MNDAEILTPLIATHVPVHQTCHAPLKFSCRFGSFVDSNASSCIINALGSRFSRMKSSIWCWSIPCGSFVVDRVDDDDEVTEAQCLLKLAGFGPWLPIANENTFLYWLTRRSQERTERKSMMRAVCHVKTKTPVDLHMDPDRIYHPTNSKKSYR